MLAPCLSALSEHLNNRFEFYFPRSRYHNTEIKIRPEYEMGPINGGRVFFCDKELLWATIEEDNSLLTFPSAAWYVSNYGDPSNRKTTKLYTPLPSSHDSLQNTAVQYTGLDLELSISISIFTNSFPDHLMATKFFFDATVMNRTVEVTNHNDTGTGAIIGHKFTVLDGANINTPPGGQESKDWERGKFLVAEGEFKIADIPLLFLKRMPVVREIEHRLGVKPNDNI